MNAGLCHAQMERRERLRRLMAQQEAVTAEAPDVGQVVVQEMAPSQVCCACARDGWARIVQLEGAGMQGRRG